jgi:hypothetical protein
MWEVDTDRKMAYLDFDVPNALLVMVKVVLAFLLVHDSGKLELSLFLEGLNSLPSSSHRQCYPPEDGDRIL